MGLTSRRVSRRPASASGAAREPAPVRTLSIVIPAYNEAPTIAQVIRRIHAVPLAVAKEIVVVVDESPDGTVEVVRSLGALVDRVHVQPRKSGKGTAVRVGLGVARGEVAVIQDADLELDPRDYGVLLEPIVSGRTEVVYGSRFLLPLAAEVPRQTVLGNRIMTMLTNVLYGTRLTDVATGYKMFRLETIRRLRLDARHFEIEAEITAKLLRAGHRILEVPVTYRPRRHAEGKKVRWHDAFAFAWCLLRNRVVSARSVLVDPTAAATERGVRAG